MKYQVTVSRVQYYKDMIIEVEADRPGEAAEKAEQEAADSDWGSLGNDAEYTVPDVTEVTS